ncbi:hypothetical protein JTE90_016985, partial [Oedothorax gibbosus]
MAQDNTDKNENDDARKIFVGGLSWNTTQEKLHEYFSRYGEVVDSVVMMNRETGKSRGFGFITYKELSCVAKVLSSGPHELDGRTIDPKVCSAESQQGKKSGQNFKVFLGGLPANCTETDLRSFFSRYGTVTEVILMYDQEKKKPRGFGFLSFEKEDSVKQVCAEHFVKINGRKIECKHAESSDKKKNSNQNNNTEQQPQWSGPQMGAGNWGPGTPGPNMGPGGPMPGPMNNGMMGPPAGGYQGGWGGPPAYGPQGWGPQPGPYGPPNNGWGWGPGYGPYGAPGPQYGPPAYGYGYNNWGPGPMGGPPAQNPPVAPGTETTNGGQAPPANNTNNNNNNAPAPSGTNPPPMGNYAQEPSNFGPTRPAYGPGYGGGPNYNPGGYPAPGNYGNPGDSQGNRPAGQPNPGYHPYSRP